MFDLHIDVVYTWFPLVPCCVMLLSNDCSIGNYYVNSRSRELFLITDYVLCYWYVQISLCVVNSILFPIHRFVNLFTHDFVVVFFFLFNISKNYNTTSNRQRCLDYDRLPVFFLLLMRLYESHTLILPFILSDLKQIYYSKRS